MPTSIEDRNDHDLPVVTSDDLDAQLERLFAHCPDEDGAEIEVILID